MTLLWNILWKSLCAARKWSIMDLFSGYVDDIIRPHVTRRRLSQDLEMLSKKDLKNPWKKHGNIPLWNVFQENTIVLF